MSALLANCIPSAIPSPTLFGAQILSLTASPITSFSRNITVDSYPNHSAINITNISFCNITVTHTHPGQGDRLNTEIWLPLDPKWNDRMKMVGGGGFAAGRADPDSYIPMAGAVAEGYVGVTIDAGLPTFDPNDWALLSPGNVDWYKLQNLASVSLNDGAVIAKEVIAGFYGRKPKYSYFTGCSQGGRQGIELAQRYPEAFDGIAAAAPGVNWPQFFISHQYPQQLMNELGHYPAGCEFETLSAAAKKACDGIDGVVDDLIADPDSCRFDPFSLVGKDIANCTSFPGAPRKWKISKTAAEVADAMWRRDARKGDGSFMWYLTGYEARMTGFGGLADTICKADGTCGGNPLAVFTEWTRLYVKKDPAFDPTAPVSRKEFEKIFRESVREYNSIMGTNDADLSEFSEAGGKMITYHGLADWLVASKNTRHYYDTVRAKDANAHKYYRYFEVPGLEHCSGGNGVYPSDTFRSLVEWVEKGKAPDSMVGESLVPGPDGKQKRRVLCPYPKKAKIRKGADPNAVKSWTCV